MAHTARLTKQPTIPGNPVVPPDVRGKVKKAYEAAIKLGKPELMKRIGSCIGHRKQKMMLLRLQGKRLVDVGSVMQRGADWISVHEKESLDTILTGEPSVAKKKTKTSAYPGVTIDPSGRISAVVVVDRRPVTLGSFHDEESAALFHDIVLHAIGRSNGDKVTYSQSEIAHARMKLAYRDRIPLTPPTNVDGGVSVKCPCGHESTFRKSSWNRNEHVNSCANCGLGFTRELVTDALWWAPRVRLDLQSTSAEDSVNTTDYDEQIETLIGEKKGMGEEIQRLRSRLEASETSENALAGLLQEAEDKAADSAAQEQLAVGTAEELRKRLDAAADEITELESERDDLINRLGKRTALLTETEAERDDALRRLEQLRSVHAEAAENATTAADGEEKDEDLMLELAEVGAALSLLYKETKDPRLKQLALRVLDTTSGLAL